MKSFLVFWNFGRGHYTKKREVIALFIANSHKIKVKTIKQVVKLDTTFFQIVSNDVWKNESNK